MHAQGHAEVVASNTMATLEQLLQSVSDVMFPDQLGQATVSLASHGYDGDTALRVFAWRDDTASARLLLEAGAYPKLRSAFGSARELAAESGGAVAALFGDGS